ncbi:DUF4838 domain-containing protein [Candidatus Poribacteria bacterium]
MKVKMFALWILALMIGCVWQAAGSDEQIELIRDGITDYNIMIGRGASPIEEFAAQELQGYVMQVTNVFLPMAPRNAPASGKLVLVGGRAAAKLGLEIDSSSLGPDGFVIKTIDNKLVLAGGGPRGTLYSVYAFLETLGCRWLAPGILGEVIPRRASIVIPFIDHSERPDITYRGFTNIVPVSYEDAQWIDWMAKNRMNYFMIPQPNYGNFKEILVGELERRGMDIGVSLDSSMAADQILEFIESNPETTVMAIYTEPTEAENSDKQHSESIAVISETMNEDHPDKLVFMMEPGRIISADNPVSRRCYRHSLGDEQCEINIEVRSNLESQLESRSSLHVHEYYMGSYSQNSLLFPILHTISSDLEYLNGLEGLDGVISQCEPGNWGTYGLNYYVFARMMWNARNDLGSIVDDYCEKYYGPAGEPMKRYYAILENAMTATEHFRYIDPPGLILELLDESSLAEMQEQIQKAEELANDAMTFDRLRMANLSLNHAKSLWSMLNSYSAAIKFQESGENGEAMACFQQTADLGEKLVAFLFQNVDEGVYIIPEGYIFDYLEPLIADALERKDLLGTE